MSESQWWDRDQDWKYLSLNYETDTETEKMWVSMTRLWLENLSLNDETETNTEKIWVSLISASPISGEENDLLVKGRKNPTFQQYH